MPAGLLLMLVGWLPQLLEPFLTEADFVSNVHCSSSVDAAVTATALG